MFRVICHLDMDAFYASVEQRDNPALITPRVGGGSSFYVRRQGHAYDFIPTFQMFDWRMDSF